MLKKYKPDPIGKRNLGGQIIIFNVSIYEYIYTHHYIHIIIYILTHRHVNIIDTNIHTYQIQLDRKISADKQQFLRIQWGSNIWPDN